MEMNALELKGKYVGHTAPKVISAFREAMGGVLFLDEAYALAGTEGNTDVFTFWAGARARIHSPHCTELRAGA